MILHVLPQKMNNWDLRNYISLLFPMEKSHLSILMLNDEPEIYIVCVLSEFSILYSQPFVIPGLWFLKFSQHATCCRI